MNNISYIAAVDPGNEKTGVAILSQAGELIYRTIVETKTFNSSFESILSTYLGIHHIVCGNGTNHKHLYPSIQQIGRNHKITTSLIDESHSTEEARKLYWQYNPPTGWRRFVPKGMQFPPEPVDDLTAYVIGKRYTKQLKEEDYNKLQDCKVEEDLEAKRLAAIKNYIMKEMHMSNVIKKIHWSSILLRCIWMIIGALIYTVGLDLF